MEGLAVVCVHNGLGPDVDHQGVLRRRPQPRQPQQRREAEQRPPAADEREQDGDGVVHHEPRAGAALRVEWVPQAVQRPAVEVGAEPLVQLDEPRRLAEWGPLYFCV